MWKPGEQTNITAKIGDTLFINGVPHKACGICDIVIKQFNGPREARASRGSKTIEVKPLKVMKGFWGPQTTVHVGYDRNAVELVKTTRRPIVHSVPACEACYSKFKDMQAAMPGHIRFFGDNKDGF